MSQTAVVTKKASPAAGRRRAQPQATPAALAKTLKALRARHSLSQEDVARLLGASWATVSRWERQVSKPTPDAAARIERLAELSELLGDTIAPENLMRFLTLPNDLIEGYAPIDMLGSPYSFQHLVNFVTSAISGDMA